MKGERANVEKEPANAAAELDNPQPFVPSSENRAAVRVLQRQAERDARPQPIPRARLEQWREETEACAAADPDPESLLLCVRLLVAISEIERLKAAGARRPVAYVGGAELGLDASGAALVTGHHRKKAARK